MKICVASVSDSIDSEISSRAARAPFLLIFENGELVESIKNPFSAGGGGAGYSVAKLLSDKGVQKFIAGNSGPNLSNSLKEKGISFEEKTGKVKDVI